MQHNSEEAEFTPSRIDLSTTELFGLLRIDRPPSRKGACQSVAHDLTATHGLVEDWEYYEARSMEYD